MAKHFASTVIRNSSGKYLAMFHTHKKERQWRFAGGKVEEGEQPMAAAVRELWEELGVTVKSMRLIMVTEPDPIDGGEWIGHFYLADIREPLVANREPDKIGDIQFFTAEELKEKGSHPEYEVVLALEQQERMDNYGQWCIYEDLGCELLGVKA